MQSHTHVCLPLHSVWTRVCVWERETQIFLLESPHSHFLIASLCAAILAYLSFPPIPNIIPSDLACHPDVCTHRPPWTLLSGSLCFSLSFTINLILLLHRWFSSPLVPWELLWVTKEVWLNVLCPPWRHQLLFSVHAPEVCVWSQRVPVKTHLMAFSLSFIRSLSSLCAATYIKGYS